MKLDPRTGVVVFKKKKTPFVKKQRSENVIQILSNKGQLLEDEEEKLQEEISLKTAKIISQEVIKQITENLSISDLQIKPSVIESPTIDKKNIHINLDEKIIDVGIENKEELKLGNESSKLSKKSQSKTDDKLKSSKSKLKNLKKKK